ncbi:MAG: hypothetical protein ACO1NW_13670 [Chitinophagaceae bacterium]
MFRFRKTYKRIKTIAAKSLLALLALLVLNSSADTREHLSSYVWNGETYIESPAHNDIESIYELITEITLGWDDHLPEADDSADEEQCSVGFDCVKLPFQELHFNHPEIHAGNPFSFYSCSNGINLSFVPTPPPDGHFA